MEAEVIKTFYFEAAHRLPNVPLGHKCRNLHGHSYRVDVHVAGRVGEQTGWVMDFAEIKRAVDPILAELDHHCLNDLPGLDNPTSERIAKYFFDKIAPLLPHLAAITVWESRTSRCVYRGS
jgi:6-pyruvoyltetrahydropterin/6-carboxytetrahydropterin synthase